jgi:hypothetical protein
VPEAYTVAACIFLTVLAVLQGLTATGDAPASDPPQATSQLSPLRREVSLDLDSSSSSDGSSSVHSDGGSDRDVQEPMLNDDMIHYDDVSQDVLHDIRTAPLGPSLAQKQVSVRTIKQHVCLCVHCNWHAAVLCS